MAVWLVPGVAVPARSISITRTVFAAVAVSCPSSGRFRGCAGPMLLVLSAARRMISAGE